MNVGSSFREWGTAWRPPKYRTIFAPKSTENNIFKFFFYHSKNNNSNNKLRNNNFGHNKNATAKKLI